MPDKKPRSLWKRYYLLISISVVAAILFLYDDAIGRRAADIAASNLGEMLLAIPPIFVILGLLDVWVPRQRMVKLMGEGAGLKGIALAFVLGSAAAGPLYGAFPVAQVLLKKGASFRNVFILLGAWSTTKIPMLLFEFSNMGARFAGTRMAMDVMGILLIALVMERFLGESDRREILGKSEAGEGVVSAGKSPRS